LPYIQFLGAAGTVTGSKHLINTAHDSSSKHGFQILIDCGLFQGQKEWRERNWQDTPVRRVKLMRLFLRMRISITVAGFRAW
jgi:metallo-beta-lactamase family protein